MIRRGRDYKLGGSTPTGRSRKYRYYETLSSPNGSHKRVRCGVVDNQIPDLLNGITVEPDLLPDIRLMYHQHLDAIKGPSIDSRIKEVESLLARLQDEEAAIARLYATGKLSEQSYDSLYAEWQAKQLEAKQSLYNLRAESHDIIDDLESALLLLSMAGTAFGRMNYNKQKRLLQILFKHIIIDTQGSIMEVELNQPFMYLHSIRQTLHAEGDDTTNGSGSSCFLSSPPMIEIVEPSRIGVARFVEMASFPERPAVEKLLHLLTGVS